MRFVFPKYENPDCQAHHFTLWQVHVLAKPTILPCSMSMYGPSPPSYLMAGPRISSSHHLTMWYFPVLAKHPILPCHMSLNLPSPSSYLVPCPCTCQATHLTSWHVLFNPPVFTLCTFLPYSSINENMSYVDG